MSKILYVEDNFQNFRLVMRMLRAEDASHEVERAEDGSSALDRVAEVQPDLIFMDINLPDIDGVEVTRRIREKPEYARIPVIALTANAMVGDREKYLDAGCDGYLQKPLSRTHLREVLEKFLPNGKAHAEASHNGSNGKSAGTISMGESRPASERENSTGEWKTSADPREVSAGTGDESASKKD